MQAARPPRKESVPLACWGQLLALELAQRREPGAFCRPSTVLLGLPVVVVAVCAAAVSVRTKALQSLRLYALQCRVHVSEQLGVDKRPRLTKECGRLRRARPQNEAPPSPLSGTRTFASPSSAPLVAATASETRFAESAASSSSRVICAGPRPQGVTVVGMLHAGRSQPPRFLTDALNCASYARYWRRRSSVSASARRRKRRRCA